MITSHRASEREYRRLSVLLAGLVLCAAGLLLFALLENSLAERDLRAARQCGFLSADGFWIWSITQPKALLTSSPAVSPEPLVLSPPDLGPLVPPAPSSAPPVPDYALPSGNWQTLFQGMGLQVRRLRSSYPQETAGMNIAWAAFANSLNQSGRVTWTEASALSDSCRSCAAKLAARAAARRTQVWIGSGVGVVFLLLLAIWASLLLGRRRRVAARIEAELQLRDTLLEAAAEGVYQVDMHGSCTYINPAGASFLGYQPKELWGKEMTQLLYRNPDDDLAAFGESPVQVALRTGQVCRRDDDLVWRRDGSCFPVATLASPILTPKGVQGAVVTFSDITSRKEAETLRDDLTGMIVHDLRTPLTALLSGLQSLRFVGNRDPAEQEILDNAIGGGETLLSMINDLLDISKWESGSLVLSKRLLPPAEVIEYALAQTASLARRNGLRVARNLPADLPLIEGDSDLLRRSLTNLLGNAVKFTPRGGIVTVSASYEAAEGSVVFAVGDTGEGIPAHQLRRIFEKFGQVESRKAGRKMSTGLGLTFCKLVAEAHGGRIWVESKLGKGSRFLFSIPQPPEAV